MSSIPNEGSNIIYGNKHDLPVEPSDVGAQGKNKQKKNMDKMQNKI